jgi:hypothetical protein
MLGIGLKLLGIGSWIKNFVAANWRWLVPLLVGIVIVLASYLYISDKISDAREEGIAQGIDYQKKIYAKQVDEENERNRKFEELLDKAISNFGRDVVEQTVERMAKETRAKDKITTIIKNNPVYEQCVVDQEVLDTRNQIRKLGPQEYPVRIKLED